VEESVISALDDRASRSDLILVDRTVTAITPATVVSLARAHNAPVVAIYELALLLGSKGVANILPMAKGGTQRIGDVGVSMVHAIHTSSIDENGKSLFVAMRGIDRPAARRF